MSTGRKLEYITIQLNDREELQLRKCTLHPSRGTRCTVVKYTCDWINGREENGNGSEITRAESAYRNLSPADLNVNLWNNGISFHYNPQTKVYTIYAPAERVTGVMFEGWTGRTDTELGE